MGQQTISIDPDLWKRTRRQAFDMGTTATSIVEQALIAYFAAMELKQGGRLAPQPAPTTDWVLAKGPVSASDLRGKAVSTIPDIPLIDYRPPQPASGIQWVGESTSEERKQMDALPPPAIYESFDESFATVEEDGSITQHTSVGFKAVVINSPSEVAAAVKAAGPREFHPVPKPTTTKKARR